MCGIVGVVATAGSPAPNRERVERALSALKHRGPDSAGLEELPGVVLGHRRLSIVDLDGGAQPMTSEDRSVWVTFNGEIWNFEELRRRLEAAGHRFTTRCDTEVLVHGYEEWGDQLLGELDGMFAFAVWDSRRHRMLLARDRMGKKPLYYALLAEGLVFGSDIRSVLLAGGIDPRVDRAHVGQFLLQRYVTGPRTLVAGVEGLRPGHALVFANDRVDQWAYWALGADRERPTPPEVVRDLLAAAVERRLLGDVPVGAFLSGGLDSAAIVALMQRAGQESVPTFTIGFDDPVYDERERARATARRFATDHHELAVSGQDFVDSLARLAWYRDSPVAEPAEIPLLLLAEFAGRHVKVVLSGEGGDELFGGYPKYRAEQLLRLPTGLPGLLMREVAKRRARGDSHRQFQRAVDTLSVRDERQRWVSWFRTFSFSEVAALLAPDLSSGASPELMVEPLSRLLQPFKEIDKGRQMLVGDLLSYLPDNMLLRGDKVSMAASLESRMPLLDKDLVERVVQAPASQRSSLRKSKRLLRDAMAGVLPAEVTSGPKRGFPVPVARFVLDDPRRVAERLLLSDRCLDRGLLRPDAVRATVHSARDHQDAGDLKLFTLLSLELWMRSNVDQVTLEPSSMEELLEVERTAA